MEGDGTYSGDTEIFERLLVAALLTAGCGPAAPFDSTDDEVEPADYYEARDIREAAPPPEAVRVATWNIKFAGGRLRFHWECPGDRVEMASSEVRDHLEAIAGAIEAMEADVVLLQEVDVDADRSAHLNQLQWLLDHTDYNYGVYATEWRAEADPGGAVEPVDTGNAILSRWPIAEGRRIPLPQIPTHRAPGRSHYLRRNILEARIRVPQRRDLRVLDTHTSAFRGDDTTRRQIAKLAERARTHDEADAPLVVGGDLNTLPPGSEREKNFEPYPDDDCDNADYTDHDGWLAPMYGSFAPAVDPEDYRSDNAPHFTYTGRPNGFWNRKLDYLFTDGRFVDGSTTTYQSERRGGIATMPLSDHAPVSTDLASAAPTRADTALRY